MGFVCQQGIQILVKFAGFFGRDDRCSPGEKRKQTTHIKMFKAPWRSDHIVFHMSDQHAEQFKTYSMLTDEQKKVFLMNNYQRIQVLLTLQETILMCLYLQDSSDDRCQQMQLSMFSLIRALSKELLEIYSLIPIRQQ